MGSPGLLLTLTCGAAAIAFWVDLRFRTLAPRRAGIRVLHLAVALGAAEFLAPVLIELVLRDARTLGLELTALFAIFLPALVYAFLSGIWVLRLLQAVLQPR